jgi:transketolase
MDTIKLAKNIRLNCLKMVNRGGGSHIGSALSIADILAVLYGSVLNVDPNKPRENNRDRFILSKGHAGVAVYAALAELGFFKKDELKTYYQNGSIFSGHISHRGIPGVEVSTGSLGHGLSIAAGMALTAKLDQKKHKVYVLLSDGECDAGSTWEAALFAAHHKLDNLIAIVDYNKIQGIDFVQNTLALEPFLEKWKSFGWETGEVDGHAHEDLFSSFNPKDSQTGLPKAVIAHTIKGKGVSFMENSVLWHYRCPRGEEYQAALKEIEDK